MDCVLTPYFSRLQIQMIVSHELTKMISIHDGAKGTTRRLVWVDVDPSALEYLRSVDFLLRTVSGAVRLRVKPQETSVLRKGRKTLVRGQEGLPHPHRYVTHQKLSTNTNTFTNTIQRKVFAHKTGKVGSMVGGTTI